MKINVRRIVRHFHKHVLYRMVERDHSVADNGVNDDVYAQCVKLLDENNIGAMVQLHRTAVAIHSAGLAANAVGASTGAAAAATKVVDSAVEDRVTHEVQTLLDAPDINGSLQTEGLRRNSLVFDSIGVSAPALLGDGSSVKSCFPKFIAQVRSTGATLASLLMTPGQLKLLLGNLQINASLTVVFSIPWPPVHTRFINFLNVFKFDLFQGLSFMAPCLHSSHFMSLASFVVAVSTISFLSLSLLIL